jgi:predicted phosphodiesterase
MTYQAVIVSDIHANRPALEAVLADMPDHDVFLCAGDMVGILGWNDWVVDAIREQADHVVIGNHDARVREDFAYAPSFPAAHDEHALVTEQLDEDHIALLNSLPDRVTLDIGQGVVLAHSRPFYFRDPGYPFHGFAQGDVGVQPKDFTRVGPHLDGRAAFIGHTHEQHAVNCEKFEGQSGLVLNPGSVGVPWYEQAEYAVVNLDTLEYDLRQVKYDTERVEDRLEEQGNPVGKYSSGSSRFNR